MSDEPLTGTRFDGLDLAEPLLRGLTDAGFTHCTPIQERALPAALEGRDVAGQAQTGTGKTAAFLLALMHRLLTHPPSGERKPTDIRVLIVAPTRELAIQIHRDAELLGAHTDLKLALAHGGVDYKKQRERIAAGCDILIGTPGRLIDYYKQRVYGLKRLEAVVLDEADRMFDLGFIRDIRFLFRRMSRPERRQNLLFSATLSYRVMELAYEHMNDPVTVKIEPQQVTADTVEQSVYYPANNEKIALLLGVLKREPTGRTLVFSNTRRNADRVRAYLNGNGFHAATLSGSVPQRKRQRLLKRFREGEIGVLVATDVAARGLHIPDVTHVINYDLPRDAEDYVHRIGRTARLGKRGHAISFACEDSAFSLPEIEDYIGEKLPSANVSPELLVEPAAPKRPKPRHRGARGRGGRGKRGKRGGKGRH